MILAVIVTAIVIEIKPPYSKPASSSFESGWPGFRLLWSVAQGRSWCELFKARQAAGAGAGAEGTGGCSLFVVGCCTSLPCSIGSEAARGVSREFHDSGFQEGVRVGA